MPQTSKIGVVVKKHRNGPSHKGCFGHKDALTALSILNIKRIYIFQRVLIKITDSVEDGNLDKVDTLKSFKGSFWGAWPHNIELSQDKNRLYVVAGKSIVIPEGWTVMCPKVWGEDNISPVITRPPSGSCQ